MKRAIPAFLSLALLGGCLGEPDAVEQEHADTQPPLLNSVGGCACPASGVAELTLDCYCAEFPGGCPSYDELKATVTRDASGAYPRCFDDSRWWLMEQTGCGRLEISTGWGLGGGTWTYDATTHELIGVQTFSDIGFASCQTFMYRAGVVGTCDEGDVCSLCDASLGECTPACSMELRRKNGAGELTYDSWARPRPDCEGLDAGAARPALRLGCGRVSVVADFGSATFEIGTHEPVRFDTPGDSQCPDGWGEPPAACNDETVCSLCEGDANECTPQQLRAE